MSKDDYEIKPILKIIGWPVIFMLWCIFRVTHVTYVDSPSFQEYWGEL